jgi:hypothetical protein
VKRRTTKAIARPGAYGPTAIARASTIVIFLAALVVAAAIVALSLTSGTAADSQGESFAGISESAHAATLAQRILQDVLRIANSRHRGTIAVDVHADLNDAAASLDQSLAALDESASGDASQELRSLRNAWSPIRKDLALLGDYPSGPRALDTVVDRTLAFSADLTAALGTVRLQFDRDDRQRRDDATFWRRLASGVALVALAVLGIAIAVRFSDAARETKRFAGMLERMVGDLAKSSLRLAGDRQEHDIIMDAAGHGMFVLGRDLRVKPPFARELGAMFGVDDVAGKYVRELLVPFVSERNLAKIDAYLAGLFDIAVSDETLALEHPLRELEIATTAGEGYGARYLDFTFRRTVEDDEVSSVFVSVDDVSERVRLARDLQQSERRRERQQALLLLTSTHPSDRIARFVAEADAECRRMGEALRPEDMALASRGHIEILRDRLGTLALAIDRLQKLAHAIGYGYLFDLAQSFEKRVLDVRRATYIDGDAFLAIVVMNAEIRAELDELCDFQRRFAKVAS